MCNPMLNVPNGELICNVIQDLDQFLCDVICDAGFVASQESVRCVAGTGDFSDSPICTGNMKTTIKLL